jgi:hypothetical protein
LTTISSDDALGDLVAKLGLSSLVSICSSIVVSTGIGEPSTTTTELRLFNVLISALMFVVGVVVGAVAYDIYLHPAGPQAVGTATIKMSGTSHFEGNVGTVSTTSDHTHTIEASVPAKVKVNFARADHVVADIEQAKPSEAGTVEIRAECTTVAKSPASEAASGARTSLLWKVPREWQEGEPPKDWPKCPKKPR